MASSPFTPKEEHVEVEDRGVGCTSLSKKASFDSLVSQPKTLVNIISTNLRTNQQSIERKSISVLNQDYESTQTLNKSL